MYRLDRVHVLFVVAILLGAAWLYAPAVSLGFIWDDPVWLSRIANKSVWALAAPIADYHFYRPVILLYHRLFMNADGTFNAPLLHAAQIGWHVLNVALVYALCRRVGLRKFEPLAVAGLVACYPFSHQAVAWAVAHQPVATVLQNSAWLAYLIARQSLASPDHRKAWTAAGVSLLFFLAALTAQESTVTLAGLPLLLEVMLYWRAKDQRPHVGLPLVYILIAAAFMLAWFQLPRQAGYIAPTFRATVWLYFLQGLLLIGRPAGYEAGQTLAPAVLLAMFGVIVAWLLAAARRAGRGRQAVFGLAFALLGIAPSAIGLKYSYVSVSPRLFYYSAPGIAMMWACALLPPANGTLARRVWRGVGMFLVGLIALQSVLLVSGFQRLYADGAAHLAEWVRAAQSGEPRVLVINFPDRYAPKQSPYPLGYWGLTLAPVSVDLGAFPAIVSGQYPRAISRTMPHLDAEAREAGPYRVDMRGIAVEPAAPLYELARQVDGVYVSRYLAGGGFELEQLGAVIPSASAAPACRLAVFEQTLCLQAAELEVQAGQLTLTLTWLSLSEAQPHHTIFAHLGQASQPPVAQADGDAWLGNLPLHVWRAGDTVRERRVILLPDKMPPARYEIRVGIYNWVTGERLRAATPQGEPLPDNAMVVGEFP